ncbi:hypothetical protein [Streptomyces daliensis]|uniref:Uncharacterized protein n=1 Tax=Streptomyces daliensis TaxID=299421 RepID=A0A8T4J5D2_9ACTN|nr:hypothetical protein [Streptomyces daliensis]
MSEVQPAQQSPEEVQELFIFTPCEGDSWGVTFEKFTRALEHRTPGEFSLAVDEPEGVLPASRRLRFGFTLDDAGIEGFFKEEPEGAALRAVTCHEAARFAEWLAEKIIPPGGSLAFTTRVNEEYGLGEEEILHRAAPEIESQLLEHVERLLSLEES